MEEKHQALIKEAHDLIFNAQQSLITDLASEPIQQHSERVQMEMDRLKELIVQPKWKTDDVSALIDDLRQATQALVDAISHESQQHKPILGGTAASSHQINQNGQVSNIDTEDASMEEQPGRPDWDEDAQLKEDTGLLRR
jgi:hypothetical protein